MANATAPGAGVATNTAAPNALPSPALDPSSGSRPTPLAGLPAHPFDAHPAHPSGVLLVPLSLFTEAVEPPPHTDGALYLHY